MIPPFPRSPIALFICCLFAAVAYPGHADADTLFELINETPDSGTSITGQTKKTDVSPTKKSWQNSASGETVLTQANTPEEDDFDPAKPFSPRPYVPAQPSPEAEPTQNSVSDRVHISIPPLPTRRDPETGLRLEQSLSLPETGGNLGRSSLPAFLRADHVDALSEQEMVAEGDVELRKGGTVLTSDKLTYWPVEDEVEATGDVVLTKNQDEIRGPRARLKIEDQIGFFENPTYKLKRAPLTGGPGIFANNYDQPGQPLFMGQPEVRTVAEAHGKAERIDMEGENQIRLTNTTYSTCKVGETDWWAQAGEIHLDYDHEVGEAWDSKIMFLGVPIFYTPWMSFSLNNQRKSGLLAPTFGSTSKGGLELTVPYYWNIAPNMDATIAPRILSKRGVQLNTEFRYLMPTYTGQIRAEYLPNDQQRDTNRVTNQDRYGYSILHSQYLLPGLTGSINFNGVSDDLYYTDLSSRITSTSQTQLLREGLLSYNPGTWFDANLMVSSYQTLHPDLDTPIDNPYKKLPQFNFNAYKFDVMRSDLFLFAQATEFSHGDTNRAEGQRWIAYPQASMPFIQPGWYVTPKIGAHLTRYNLDRQLPGFDSQITRTMPILSIDSGLTLERPLDILNLDLTQTLEPRLYYLYIPYRNQEAIPVFDTAYSDFDFAQAFSENRFIGQDRINDANQVTLGLTSRLLNSETGAEIIKGMIGQRYYFETPRVMLYPSETPPSRRTSDFLAAFSGTVMPHVTAGASWQYDVDNGYTSRFSAGGRYQPAFGKVVNVNYRLDRDSIKQIDLSGQWPIYRGWYGVARYNYDFLGSRLIEGIGGIEYNAGCWVARFVVQRFEATAGSPSTSVFLQLELNDFSRIGSNPLDLLKRSIQGYGTINQPTADPIFGAN